MSTASASADESADEQKRLEDQDQKDCRDNDEVQRQPGELRQILRTSDFYKTKNLPERFDRPGFHTTHNTYSY